jgi:hypothetical protein
MELVERPDMRAVHFLNSISFDCFKAECIRDAEIKHEKKPTLKDIQTWYTILKQFCKTNIKTKGITKRVYAFSATTPAGLGGRLFSGGSMQGIWSPYRGLLMHTSATDIDMSNAHPVILRFICRLHDIDCPALEYYVNNREACLAQFATKKEGKNAFLVATNNDKHCRIGNMPVCFREYDREMKRIQAHLVNIPQYTELVDTVPEYRASKNYNGCAINRILCYYENIILQHAIHFVNNKGIEIAILMFDGLMIYGMHYDDDSLLTKMADYVESMMPNLQMKWTYKEHDTSVSIPEDFDETNYSVVADVRLATDDTAAAEIILKDLEPHLACSKSRIFLKHGNVWLTDDNQVQDHILSYVLRSNIGKLNGKETYVPYSQNLKSAKNIRDVVVNMIRTRENEDVYEKFHSTTRGRLCFRDGVLDFANKQFYRWDNLPPDFEYLTTCMIHYDYADYFANPNYSVIALLHEKIFEPLFGDKVELALRFLSRAIAGHAEDKNWATYLGNRNCGKGVLYDALSCAFECYVKTFELGNILYERNRTDLAEVSRKLYWLLDFEFVRAAISQETPPPEQGLFVSGKLIKKLAGGGDTHVARHNYDRIDTHFKIDTTFMIMGNNTVQIDVADAMEHCVEFCSVVQFKTQEEIDQMLADGADKTMVSAYKVKDDTIKDKCRTMDWKLAIVYLLFQNYSESAVAVALTSKHDDDYATTVSLRQRIFHHFVIFTDVSKIPKDEEADYYIPVADVVGTLRDCKSKIKNELLQLGLKKKKCQLKVHQYKNTHCYYGLKYKPNPDESTSP